MDALLGDLRFAFRLMRKTPAVSVATIVTLALGVGLNAGVFTILNAVMFRPRVTADPGSFVRVPPVYSGAGGPRHESPPPPPRDYQALRDPTTALDPVAAWTVVHTRLGPEAADSL